ncbi:helix-turn-helix domain-containing protein [Muricauda sp. 2012CJ35-5]|uniref:Helix-turn-helix domain-containing protein n=1 Tax=Flagellimonas spongiicola TaxID=2942208 RepID=A0ABT0PVR0_9FLAO|nr:helix-turn-helix transcriptional regulator [Allomuricauda spongiicola]MCL6275440.1 helix-turn-helix domain-containing protein [Allomuricauda spongiicola]
MYRKYKPEDLAIVSKVGKKIRAIREAKGMSQLELAIDADIPKTQVGRVERGENNTSLVTLNRIATALEVPLSALFQFNEEEPK